jgi:hypothetical protein
MPASTYTSSGPGSTFQAPAYQGVIFDWKQSPDKLGAPLLTNKDLTVNVFDQYPWTLSPMAARQYIPKAIITEYRQTQSSELRGYLYSIRGTVSNLTIANKVGSTESLNGFTQSLGQEVKTASTIAGQGKVGSAIQKAASFAVDKTTSVATAVLDSAKKFDITPKSGEFAAAMDPYSGLYAVENTGFVYYLPYYTSANMMKVSNAWNQPGNAVGEGLGKMVGGISNFYSGAKGKSKKPSKESSGSGREDNKEEGSERSFGKMLSGIIDVAGGATDVLFGATAGATQKEELKSYQGSSTTEDAEFSFYLYNTLDNEDVKQLQKNWEFCYLITYQNLPNRKGINFLDAPCLYKIDIPGYKNIPLAYLSGLSIENVGNTRLVDLTTGEVVNADNGNVYVKLMPEAYKIRMTFTGVLTNSRNLFLNNADPSQKVTVTTSLGK